MKVGLGVERDTELVGAVRKALGPNVRLMIDANQSWTIDEAVARLKMLEKYKLVWIEEPLLATDIVALTATIAVVRFIFLRLGLAIELDISKSFLPIAIGFLLLNFELWARTYLDGESVTCPR